MRYMNLHFTCLLTIKGKQQTNCHLPGGRNMQKVLNTNRSTTHTRGFSQLDNHTDDIIWSTKISNLRFHVSNTWKQNIVNFIVLMENKQ